MMGNRTTATINSSNLKFKENDMSWSKLKQNLESFLSPALQERVEYRATGYRYTPDKAGLCYIAVDKKNVFNMSDKTTLIKWYQTEQEIKNDATIQIPVSDEEIEAVRKESKGVIPEDRLQVIARSRKLTELSKEDIERSKRRI